ncbi:MAG: hypothetical protein HY858_06090 [Candidatus Solibacter usitatus]|nr:hypothetical protein [Candidatus Solibacter usitatus]
MALKWLKLGAVLLLSLSMVAAPCRNCQPKQETAKHCGHDCCPKPKPVHGPEKSCSWQPAGDAAVEGKDAKQDLAITPPGAAAGLPASVDLPAPHQPVLLANVILAASPPPLYLSLSTLLL